MSDPTTPEPNAWTAPADPSAAAPPPAYAPPPAVPGGYAPAAYGAGPGSLGTPRSTGVCMLLYFVTFGIYGLYWYYTVHAEMKRHSGTGLGGGIALLLAFFVGIASPFITSSEVGELYQRQGQPKPVSGTTGLWAFPGIFIIVGPFIWFAKTNGAINDYWRALGAR